MKTPPVPAGFLFAPALDNIPKVYNLTSVLLTRGRCHEASGWWSRARRSRVSGYAPGTPERGRTPPGHTRVPCEELADGVSFGRLAESADRTLDNAAMERREAPYTRLVYALATRMRRLALHLPRLFEGGVNGPGNGAGNTAYPGPVKNAGDTACLMPPPQGEGGE